MNEQGAWVYEESRRMSDHPPRPRLILRVGVSGHRPEGRVGWDANALRAEAGKSLRILARNLLDLHACRSDGAASAYGGETPILRIVSPLAEGADRIVAREALILAAEERAKPEPAVSFQVELYCPLPFRRETYRQDFGEASRKEFDDLLSGQTALELDGSRESQDLRGEAYEAAGRAVLDQSDVLIAVWDGQKPRGRGGTGQIIEEAVRRRLPVVWIHALPAHAHTSCLLAWSGSGPRCGDPVDRLGERLAASLAPPCGQDPDVTGGPDLRATYFHEARREWTLGFLWKSFRGLVCGGNPGRPAVQAPDFDAVVRKPSPPAAESASGFQQVLRRMDDLLLGHLAWADGLADHYANLYRSSFVLNYLFGALAVMLALMPLALGWTEQEHPMHHREGLFMVGEFIVICSILANTIVGMLRRWHERWIDYRLLAEYLRQIRFLAPLGRLAPYSSPPSGRTDGDPKGSWMYWLAQAVAREAGSVGARLDRAYLDGCRAQLLHHIEDQRDYHTRNMRMLHTLDRRLQHIGLSLFALTLLACLAHLFAHSPWLTLLSAVLPALGAALAGIRSHGEFEIGIKRSRAAADGLDRLSRELRDLEDASSTALGGIAESAADLMIEETLGWRLVSEAKPLELSG